MVRTRLLRRSAWRSSPGRAAGPRGAPSGRGGEALPGGIRGRHARTACKPDSVRAPKRPWMTIHLTHPSPGRSSRQPGSPAGDADAGSLFGVAPGGACHAVPVARSAVGPYPTVSPLPARMRAVCSLWRCPSALAGRALPGTVSPWSPDFPRPRRAAVIQPSAPDAARPARAPGQAAPAPAQGQSSATRAASPASTASAGPASASGRKRSRKALRRSASGAPGS